MLSTKDQKFIKSLKIKKYRVREKRFLVEGTKNVLEALNSDLKVDFVVGTPAFYSTHMQAIDEARFEEVKPSLLTSLGTLKTNDAALAVVQMRTEVWEDKPISDTLFLLDGVSDPGNLGTIIRTLDWFGHSHLICSPDTADFYNPKTIASTMGSFARVRVYYQDLAGFLDKHESTTIYAADMQGEDVRSLKIGSPCFIIMGSESHGLTEKVMKRVHHKISIPSVSSKAESLNVGVATGIIASYLTMPK